MPKKAGKKKKGKGKKGKKKGKSKLAPGLGTPADVVKRMLRLYERNCLASGKLICPGVRSAARDHMEADTLMTKFIVKAVEVSSAEDPEVCLGPLLGALRQERYTFIQQLHVWDLLLVHEHVASLALLLERGVYPIQTLELMDCLIAAESIRRLSLSFNACSSLTVLVLDYNEFGDDGCEGLCRGLENNKSLLSVSLCYCDLGVKCGKMLGRLICYTAVRDVFLDGNELLCVGAMDIISGCVNRAEEEAFEREEKERLKLEEEAIRAELEKEQKRRGDTSGGSDLDDKSSTGGKKKGKKGKRKKKKKGPPAPPPVGPWLHKLHLADNGIDTLGSGGQLEQLICMRLFRRLIANSKCLEELDLDDNLIGDSGGREVMEALQDRKDAGLGSMKLKVTHRMNSNTFNTIVKLGAGLTKKKKKRGKKKKK